MYYNKRKVRVRQVDASNAVYVDTLLLYTAEMTVGNRLNHVTKDNIINEGYVQRRFWNPLLYTERIRQKR